MVTALARVVDESAHQRIVAAEWQRQGLLVRFADGLVCLAPASEVLAGHRIEPTKLALDSKDPSCLIVYFGRSKTYLPWDFLRDFGDEAHRARSAAAMKDSLAHIARRVRSWRKQVGLSQEGLAERVGLSRATIARLELGQGGVTLATLERIAGGMGTTYEEAFGAH